MCSSRTSCPLYFDRADKTRKRFNNYYVTELRLRIVSVARPPPARLLSGTLSRGRGERFDEAERAYRRVFAGATKRSGPSFDVRTTRRDGGARPNPILYRGGEGFLYAPRRRRQPDTAEIYCPGLFVNVT